MIIFFADRPLRIFSKHEIEKQENKHYNKIIDVRLEQSKPSDNSGHVLYVNVTSSFAIDIVQMLQQSPPKELLSVTLVALDKKDIIDAIKLGFKVIKAAGGIVMKKDKCLMIYRKGKWDLPKGKLDKGERSRQAAVREIEEETGVEAKLDMRICTTWHTYKEGVELVLKRTKWYLLECESDKKLMPQIEEDIEKLEWVNPKNIAKYLINSYSSIRYVFEEYNATLK